MRCIDLVTSIKRRRSRLGCVASPILVWEPIPDLCTPEELNNLQIAAQHVDIISPNGDELAQLFVEKPTRLEMVHALGAQVDVQSRPSVIVRDGANGSRLYCGHFQLHLRAYHQKPEMVIDPTGGGNTFLGALAIGLTNQVDPSSLNASRQRFPAWDLEQPSASKLMHHLHAAVHATIAASFSIEQVGVPALDSGEEDCWNGQRYRDRFEEYLQREGANLEEQLAAYPKQ